MEKKEEKQKTITKEVILIILILLLLVVSVVGISFSNFMNANSGRNKNEVSSGTISMTYTEDTNGISIENAVPTSDEAGKKLNGSDEYFDFTVKSELVGNSAITYEVAAIKEATSTIKDSEIKLYLEQKEGDTYKEVMAPTKFIPITTSSMFGSPKGAMVLLTESHSQSKIDTYRLRMWLDESAIMDFSVKKYAVKINIYAKSK